MTKGDMRRALDLPGWSKYSVWGYDTGLDSYFAQLWPDGDPERGDGPPKLWVSGVPAIGTLKELAQHISAVTNTPWQVVLYAMRPGEPDDNRPLNREQAEALFGEHLEAVRAAAWVHLAKIPNLAAKLNSDPDLKDLIEIVITLTWRGLMDLPRRSA